MSVIHLLVYITHEEVWYEMSWYEMSVSALMTFLGFTSSSNYSEWKYQSIKLL